ncbi:hypothetical protein TD95_005044 [Thielaviopsis punctulata]|uniref:Proteasome component ECM29 n=1 Tax=Thielaviopsis punctulata TaxID=72032 RepID=A0A0F4ZLJ0_9PEZI|nr:hypothetical protein TD95_005044 [Thielaviopsis punctulata]
MPAGSTEARELELVSKVEFSILKVATDEEKLQPLLNKYLAPLLLKAASSHANVRVRVIQFAHKLRTFIEPPKIVLPVSTLLDQLVSAESSILKQLDVVFIRHSLPRLTIDEYQDLFVKLVTAAPKEKDQKYAAILFNLLLRILPYVKFPPRGSNEDKALREKLVTDQNDVEFFTKWLGLVLILKIPTPITKETITTYNSIANQDIEFLQPWTQEMDIPYQGISQLKIAVVHMLASGIFEDRERFLPALYASANVDSNVSSIGSDLLKKSNVNLEDERIAKALFDTHSALEVPYRTKILTLLTKSDLSTTMTASIIKVIERDLGINEPVQASKLERTKLHRALFEYIKFAAAVGPSLGEFSIGPKIIQMLQDYIVKMGWPSALLALGPDIGLRCLAYEIIGVLGKASSFPFQERFALADWLFQSLSEETAPETVMGVEGALSMLSTSFKPDADTTEEQKKMLIKMLVSYMEKQVEDPVQRSVRHVAVKWANRCLPFSNVEARWIDVLALADNDDDDDYDEEVVEEGSKGLDPWMAFTYSSKEPTAEGLPDWKEMVVYFFGARAAPEADVDMMDTDNAKIETLENFPPAIMQAYPHAIQACVQMMMLRALDTEVKIEPGWAQNIKSLFKTDLKTRTSIKKYLSSPDNMEACSALLKYALSGVFAGPSESVVEACLTHTVQVASMVPYQSLAVALASFSPSKLQPLLLSPRKEIRALAAEAYGLLTSQVIVSGKAGFEGETDYIFSLINPSGSLGSVQQLIATEAGILAYGYLMSRLVFYGSKFPDSLSSSRVPLTIGGESISSRSKASDSSLDAILETLANLWAARLCVPPVTGDESAGQMIEMLTGFAKKGKEKAICCLGRLALACEYTEPSTEGLFTDDEGVIPQIIRALFGLYETKQVEVHFAIGEAISAVVAGWEADSVKLILNVDSDVTDYQVGRRPLLLAAVLDRLIQDSKSTKPALLKASGIWLFSLVQYCSHLEQVHQRLRECQAAFMRLLSARDDMVQETASRGLTLVYEKGDEELRGRLVEDLVAAFTGGTTRIKVEEETELFEPGALPTGDGQSVTSYKDIVNLASEVGDQTLIYKFMSLAANANMWSTRSAFGRFGLSSILSDTDVDPKLYPKLYRYRFDPNPNVQRSMNDIWKAMVKEPAATLDQHFDLIMEDLLKSIVGKEWRVREASCAAISDLIQGRKFAQYEKYYPQLWTAALKVIDDVKGSVRKAALTLCMTLWGTLARTLENSTESASTKAMMAQALEFLLSDKGTDSSVEDVKLFSTITLLDVCKKGGKNLRPYIPDIVPHLLGLLSTIEPEMVGYAYQKVSHDTKQAIDKKRAAMANQSPISEAIDNCLRFADTATIEALYPRLEATIKSAVGMPTKIGCGRVLGTIFMQHAMDIKPMMGKLMTLLLKHLFDANDEVSKSYARAAAYGMRVAGPNTKKKFCDKLADHYFNAEDEKRRQRVSDAVLALSKTSPDEFTNVETAVLPLVFFASNDVDAYVKTVFSAVWDQHAGSSRTVARYVPEVVALVQRGMDSAKWDMQHTAAFTVSNLVVSLGRAMEATGQLSDGDMQRIWPVLERALALKTFAGKEKLLECFPVFVRKAKSLWQRDAGIAAAQKKIAVREAKRNNTEYRVHAYVCLWKFAASRDDLDMHDEVSRLVVPAIDDFLRGTADQMDIDHPGTSSPSAPDNYKPHTATAANDNDDADARLAEKALQALAKSYSRARLATAPYAVIAAIAAHARPYLAATQLAPMRRAVWYDALGDVLGRPAIRACADGEFGVARELLHSLDMHAAEVGTEAQRLARVGAVEALVAACKKGLFGDVSAEEVRYIKELVEGAMQQERGIVVRKKWQKVLDDLAQVSPRA